MKTDLFTIDLFRDLYAHMEWADALIWNTAFETEKALDDDDLRTRLFHVHMTQRVFFEVWKGEASARRKPEEYPSLSDVFAFTTPYYAELNAFLDDLDPTRLNEPTPLPWAHFFARRAGHEAEMTSLGETMFQVASHSTHHRAQNNLILRQLGAEPPLVDYIGWLWAGRPAANWPTDIE